MKKCFLDNLPKVVNNKNKIDWVNSSGYCIPFVYKHIEGELYILKYTGRQKVKIKYNDKEYDIATSQLHNCGLGVIVGDMNRDYIYKIDEIIDYNGNAIVVEHTRKGKDNNRHYILRCLKCNGEYQRSEYHLKDRGVKCPICGDGISYPNKFMNSLLSQLKCSFKNEFIFNFAKDKKYDFYIEDINAIVEVHGIQHYKRGFEYVGGRTLEEEQENDRLKEQLAKENGIEHYIVIDARESSVDWIKNNVINSELNKLYDLSKVDWNKCDEFSVSSLLLKACSLFEDNDCGITKK